MDEMDHKDWVIDTVIDNHAVPAGHHLDGVPPKMEPLVYMGVPSLRILDNWPRLTLVDDVKTISGNQLWIETELPVEALDLTVAQRAADITQYAMGRLIHHFWTLLSVSQMREMQRCFMDFAVGAWDELKLSDKHTYGDYMVHLQRFEEAYPMFKSGIQFLPEEYEQFRDLVVRKEALRSLEHSEKKGIHPKPTKKRYSHMNAFVNYALEVFAVLALHIETKATAHMQMRFFDHQLAGAVELWKDRRISINEFEFSVRHMFQFSAPWALFVEIDYEFDKYCAIRRKQRELMRMKYRYVSVELIKRDEPKGR